MHRKINVTAQTHTHVFSLSYCAHENHSFSVSIKLYFYKLIHFFSICIRRIQSLLILIKQNKSDIREIRHKRFFFHYFLFYSLLSNELTPKINEKKSEGKKTIKTELIIDFSTHRNALFCFHIFFSLSVFMKIQKKRISNFFFLHKKT
jgi:hypothetical protein